jgi:DNA repair protein RecO (recombination protein O)
LALITTTALCLRKIDFSESSQILTLLTDRLGITGAIAKGAKREKSGVGGPLDLMCLYDVVLYDRSRRDVLSILAQAQLIEFFPELRESYAGFYAAEALRELLLSIEVGQQDGRAVLLLAVACLREARENEFRALARFAFNLLRLLGVEPSFMHCAITGKEPSGKVAVSFSLELMGLISPPHDENRRHMLKISARTLGALRSLSLDENGKGIAVDAWRGAFTLLASLVALQGGRKLVVAPRLDVSRAV